MAASPTVCASRQSAWCRCRTAFPWRTRRWSSRWPCAGTRCAGSPPLLASACSWSAAASVGLLAVAAARALGLEVDLEARHPHQKAAGERLGAGAPDGEYDVVIEAAGTESSLASCIEHAVPGGRIAVVGVHQGALPLAGVPFMVKELTVAASLCYDCGRDGHELAQAAAVLAADPDIAATVVTHRFPLADAAEALSRDCVGAFGSGVRGPRLRRLNSSRERNRAATRGTR